MKSAKKTTGVASSVEIVPAPTQSEEFSQARIYVNAIRSMMHGAGAMSIVLGAELERLHKLFCRPKGRPKLNSQRVGDLSWDERVEMELGISHGHAWNCQRLYKEAKKRLPAFASIAQELLDTPLRDIPDVRRAELVERTHKLLPYEGLRQLMWEWDVCRGTRGSDNTPRDENGQRIAEPRRSDAQIALDEFREESFAACRELAKAVTTVLDIAGPKKERAWYVLSDADLARLKEHLHDAYRGVLDFQNLRKAHAHRGRKS